MPCYSPMKRMAGGGVAIPRLQYGGGPFVSDDENVEYDREGNPIPRIPQLPQPMAAPDAGPPPLESAAPPELQQGPPVPRGTVRDIPAWMPLPMPSRPNTMPAVESGEPPILPQKPPGYDLRTREYDAEQTPPELQQGSRSMAQAPAPNPNDGPPPIQPSGEEMSQLEQQEDAPPPLQQPRIQDTQTRKLMEMAQRVGQEKPKLWQNILGGVLQASPRTRGIDVHPNITRHRQELGVQQMLADEERKGQVAQSTADWHRESAEGQREYRLASVAQRKAEADQRANAAKSSKLLPGVIVMEHPTEKKPWNYRQQHDPVTGAITNIPLGPAAAKPAAPSGAAPRIIASAVITPASYKARTADGEEFLDVNGDPIEAELAPNEVLQMIGLGGGKVAYARRNQSDKVVDVGGRKYAIGPQDVQNLPHGAGTELGLTRTPSSSTRQSPAVDAEGNPTVNVFTGTRTPTTPGIPGRSSAPPTTPGPQSSTSVSPPITPTSTRPARPVIPAIPQANGAPGTSPNTANTATPATAPPKQQWNFSPTAREAQMKVIRPIREATVQIFGDPTQPDQRSLKDFSHLANDAGAKARTAKFLRLTLDAMREQEAGGHAGAGASIGPISVSAGGFGHWLQERLRVPGAIAELQVAKMTRALQDMESHPEEIAYVDALLAARSAAVGLRAATGGSAHKFAVDALEQDLPVLGINTNSAEQYLDKLQHVAGIAANGVKGYNVALVDQDSPGTYTRIRNLTGELQRMKGGGQPARTAPRQNGGATGNPKPGGYVVGQRYGGLTYLGGDVNQQTSWKK